MTNFNMNFNGGKSGTGLFCVWVPVQKNGRAQLASIWIDPKMNRFGRSDQDDCVDHAAVAKESEEVIAEQNEGSMRRTVCVRARQRKRMRLAA